MTANVVWIDDMTQRPAMRCRSSSSASRADSPRKRSVSTSLWPIVLPSITPETESDSSTSVEMSASEPCLTRVISRRCAPTRRVSRTNTGSSANATSESCQLRNSIANAVAMTVVTFETMDVAVDVTTLCTPPMSLAMRDCTSPVRVRVKNASERRWRCAYTDARRSCMTSWPMRLESQVCPTPITPVRIGIATMPATSRSSLVVSICRALREDAVEQLAQQERRDRRDRRGAPRSGPSSSARLLR